MAAGILAGGAGIVLGILSILNVAPTHLVAVALIVLGGGELLDFIAKAQMRALRMLPEGASAEHARMAVSAVTSTDSAGVLVGVGLVALGIIALAGIVPQVLISAALLGFGTYLLLEGAAAAGRTWKGMAF